MDFIRKDAKNHGLGRGELDVFEFNENALKFYKSVGFKTSRRFMEIEV